MASAYHNGIGAVVLHSHASTQVHKRSHVHRRFSTSSGDISRCGRAEPPAIRGRGVVTVADEQVIVVGGGLAGLCCALETGCQSSRACTNS